MPPVQTSEQKLLSPVETIIKNATRASKNIDALELRWQILEGMSARLGGFDPEWYQQLGRRTRVLPHAVDTAKAAVAALKSIEIHPTLALASLAQPTLDMAEKRATGSYYTDFRLANFAALAFSARTLRKKGILDPACGSGILLAATALRLAGKDRTLMGRYLADLIVGVDASQHALRAARLVLSSLTSDKGVLRQLRSRLACNDSLLAQPSFWNQMAPDGIRGIVMNPPWERLRPTRHEFLSATGIARHYGHDYETVDVAGYELHRAGVRSYSDSLAGRYSSLVGREIDLYEAFLALGQHLLEDGGTLSAIVPSGLIRSLGTSQLRKRLIDESSELDISIFDNHAHFFAIDTRFKFLCIRAEFGRSKVKPIRLSHPTGHPRHIEIATAATIGRKSLKTIRPDLSPPEVRNNREWRLYHRLASVNPTFGQASGWKHDYCREVDMSRDRALFERANGDHVVPLVEGRMVHQFTSSAKKYIGGTGRRSLWKPSLQSKLMHPQFWFPVGAMRKSIKERAERSRVGFCDITGQTNERTMLAALVPSGVICGNKVPTLLFEDDHSGLDRAFAFLGIANSHVFDWLLRRTVTTTVNYFILDSVPFPALLPSSLLTTRISQLARKLVESQHRLPGWVKAEIRAEIDLRVANAYGVTADQLAIMFEDFPLLDRSEPALVGETYSTVTRDFLLFNVYGAASRKREADGYRSRVEAAKNVGAVPYRPSHLAEDQTTFSVVMRS